MTYDIAIIGSGPGGYVASLYASRHKKSVCVVEEGPIGGTCLNRGCIPTKSLLYSASLLNTLKGSARYGIAADNYRFDFGRAQATKNEIVERLGAGIETLFRANKIDLIRGRAKITAADCIEVDGSKKIKASYIILAPGSKVMRPKNLELDEADVLSSDGILNITSVPGSICIVGAGAIGCEFATLLNSLGSKVTMVELAERALPAQSHETSKKLETLFRKRGIEIFTSCSLSSISKSGRLKIGLTDGKTIEAEKVLISTGRMPNTDDMGIDELGLSRRNGMVAVDGHLRTEIKNIYAIGDCVDGPRLAHKASYDALVACDNILGNGRLVDYTNIPMCIWTDPEIASVGLSDEEIKMNNPDAKTVKFPYLASGKAFIEGKTEGFVKITGTPQGEILNIEIFGSGACDLIGEAVLARTMGIKIGQWRMSVHGHPTISEILQEACGVFCGTPINSI